jgi:uncharacterized protein (DUF1330 family)
MPKGYAIFTEAINDQAGMAEYAQKAVATISGSGGRVIVVQEDPDVLEGEWHGSRTVIVEFDSVEAALAWYRSPDYQACLGLRHAAAETNAVIVAGV